ncbi:MAG TPA: helix-turn-helix domain-containing protein [Blastocatellia bacterium]|nr:helix-turn-helix domain-containing protein [Blastocatellia bacterium]
MSRITEIRDAVLAEQKAKTARKKRPIEKLAFNCKEAAAALGVEESFIRQEINAGNLKARMAGSKILIPTGDLLSWLENLRDKAKRDRQASRQYVTQMERAQMLAQERSELLKEARDMAGRSVGYSAGGVHLAFEFDATGFTALAQRIAEVQGEMLTAIQEANSQADLCNGAKLKLRKPIQ